MLKTAVVISTVAAAAALFGYVIAGVYATDSGRVAVAIFVGATVLGAARPRRDPTDLTAGAAADIVSPGAARRSRLRRAVPPSFAFGSLAAVAQDRHQTRDIRWTQSPAEMINIEQTRTDRRANDWCQVGAVATLGALRVASCEI